MGLASNVVAVQSVPMVRTHSVGVQQQLTTSSGSLTTGQGNRYVPKSRGSSVSVPHFIIHRFVLATTQELHEKITELCSRVRDLEDALRASHSQNSTKPHPLLTDELLRVKAPLQRESPPINPTTINQQEEENNPDVIDSFGTLAINRSGHTNYYGQFANSWVSRQFTFTLPTGVLTLLAFQSDSASYRFGNVICVVSRKLTLRFRTRWETSRTTTLALMTFVTSFLPKYCSSVVRFLSRRWSDRLQTR